MKRTLLITDWNPNGTNDLLVANESGEVVDALDEVTFGINIFLEDKDAAFEIEPELFVKEVTLKEVVAKLAISPVRTHAEAYTRLMTVLNGGEK